MYAKFDLIVFTTAVTLVKTPSLTAVVFHQNSVIAAVTIPYFVA
jgi:hypothetical protein